MSSKPKVRTISIGPQTDLVYKNLDTGAEGTFPWSEAPQSQTVGVTFGGDVPNWKQKIKMRQSATTSLVASDLVVEQDGPLTGSFVSRQKDPYGNVYPPISLSFKGTKAGLTDNPPGVGTELQDAAYNGALMEFVKATLKYQQSLQGLVLLGELRETIEFIKRPAKALRNYVDVLHGAAMERAKRKRRGENLRKTLAQTWLEWSYAAQPLVSDIKGGALALARLTTYHPPSKVIVGEGGAETRDNPIKREDLVSGVKVTTIRQNFRQAHVKLVGLTTLSFPGYRPVQGQLGVTFRDIIPAAWELIPYSFLIDYFTNVQEIVNGACFGSDSVVWLRKGTQDTSARTLVGFDLSINNPDTHELISNTVTSSVGTTIRRVSKNRSDLTGLTQWVPKLVFDLPFGLNRKTLNIAALAEMRGHLGAAARK